MKLHQSLIILIPYVLCFLSMPVWADEGNQTLVEVQTAQDSLASYSERRGANSMMFGVDYEPLILKNFVSVSDGSSYSTLFSTSSISLVHLSWDYKRNIDLGSISVGVDYGTGTVSGILNRSLELKKYGLGLRFALDNLFDEPYVVPYFAINYWKMQTNENLGVTSVSQSTDIGNNSTFGVMIQLNWIDSRTANVATFNYGLENTYLDLYATQYQKTQSSADIDTSTDVLWGAGIRLEF